jgi:hypothetical protein
MDSEAKGKVVPFRELDTDGKTQRLHQRGRDLQLKKRRQEVITCIQQNDHIIQDVYDFLKTLDVPLGGSLKRKRTLPQLGLEGAQENEDDSQNLDSQSSLESQEPGTKPCLFFVPSFLDAFSHPPCSPLRQPAMLSGSWLQNKCTCQTIVPYLCSNR